MYAVKTDKLCKRRGEFLLDGISLELPKGYILGLVGENGAGKSTFISLLLGMLRPDGGSINILGSSDNSVALKNDIGVVLSEPFMPQCMNASMIDKMYSGIYKNWQSDTFFRYIKQFNVPDNKVFSALSRGNKMKLAIASALSHDAKLLILDEATSGLDPIVRDDILDVLYDFTSDDEHSILISSHITGDLERLCDYIAFIHKGRIILSGEKDEICESYVKLSCSNAELKSLDKDALIGVRRGEYSDEVIAKRNALCGLTGAPVSLEELFLYMVKYGEEEK